MKILYAIQGTGNGHVSRAHEVVPLLAEKGELDVLISGIQADVQVPYPIKFRHYGLSFIFGKKGGVDLWDTFQRAKPFQLLEEIKQCPVQDYDIVISDFEPVTSWACKRKGLPCISLSHQAGVMSPKAPPPERGDPLGKLILHNYAPATASYGFHFARFDKHVFTPVIRRPIRKLSPETKPHYTVYLPAYADEHLLHCLSQIKEVEWQVFSKHNKQPFTKGNVSIQPINNDAFIESMATGTGVLSGAGFETPAEALFLKKKVLVIPMAWQYEQFCNAAGAAYLGVPVVWKLADSTIPQIRDWVNNGKVIPVDFPDQTNDILDLVLHNHQHKADLSLEEFLALRS